ncbi:Cytochrome c-554 precursor [Pirellula sp. SH-Sr6A]|uniref:multiheme c-type cytochrome n=1 Tax=Pirellula sp. SH-Sr6A TaxID=1632865 RepID=UPI00078E2520|nr:multiheme c-type cytochrome [Pirellula sp. SH-Sr6A]AMV31198.1 Cytochrome c-554 precursor [Pirellula sp. SH-Sr6A]
MAKRQQSIEKRRFLRRAAILSLLIGASLGLPILTAAGDPPKRFFPGLGKGKLGNLWQGNKRPDLPSAPNSSTEKIAREKTVQAGERRSEESHEGEPVGIPVNTPQTQIPTNKVDRAQTSLQESATTAPPVNVATEAERNQVIAPDWKDPWAVFFVTGRQFGYMEPCGCTGLENQKGGLMRRDSLLEGIRNRGWNVIPLDAGNQVRSRGKQSEIKFDWTSKAFSMMGYGAVTFGEDDLKLSQDTLVYQLVSYAGDSNGSNGPLFVSANVSIFPDLDTTHKVIRVGNKKIGITGVLGDENASKLETVADSLTIKPAKESLAAVKKLLDAERCDFTVLLAHASLEESRLLAKSVPGFSMVITAGGYGEPTYRPELIPGTETQMVQVGTKGMYAGLVGLFNDAKEPLRYQRLALSSQFEDSPRMVELFSKYQDQLKAEGMERLGKRPQNHPTQREFVGSEKCGECHTAAYDIWKNTPHAHATDSIVEPPERSLPRHFDPECISCHTTGWNPQDFLPYKTGYESLEKTPHMTGNGCENCHGPGKNHADAESGDIEATKELLAKLRQEMQLPLAKAHDKCLECHDIDNSPDFHKDNAFEEYWEQVKHYGKD